jgi:Zn-dependent M28 family amino/carboxypeptidase
LKNEFVLLSGHQDHDGVRQKIWSGLDIYGADDNASTCVAMLAMARAYKKQPAKRSVLFVFHGAEERGLWARIGIRRTQQFLKSYYCSIEWRYDW